MAVKQKVTEKKPKKKEKKINATQAGSVIGLHPRYRIYLEKNYVGRVESINTWAEVFKQEGLIKGN
jgi:hypothetical protein